MRLGLNLGHHLKRGDPEGQLALALEAERLGYRSVWLAEAYGSDAPTSVAWLAAQTTSIGLGTAVMQIPGRTPAMAAMTAASLDMLSGGRFHLGLGISGPQVSEGWHGVRFADPLPRTREYVEVVRRVLRRERVSHDGIHHPLPLPDGPGVPLRLTLHPPRPDLPIYLGAVGPRNLALAGQVADGWLGAFFSTTHGPEVVAHLRAGRAGTGRPFDGFDVAPTVPVVIGEDLARCAARASHFVALYIGGMGSRKRNFYNDLVTRMGYGEAARTVRELYLAGRHTAAAAAVPERLIDETSLLGTPARIAERLHAFAAAGVTTFVAGPLTGSTQTRLRTVRVLAEALSTAGLDG